MARAVCFMVSKIKHPVWAISSSVAGSENNRLCELQVFPDHSGLFHLPAIRLNFQKEYSPGVSPFNQT